MSEGSSPTRGIDVQKHIRMLWSLESGLFDSIECPACGQREVSAWFTNPADGEYNTWFVCSACGYESQAQNEAKPTMFRANRIHPELQKRDEEIKISTAREWEGVGRHAGRWQWSKAVTIVFAHPGA